MAFGIKWLKPELDEPKYWLHIGILLAVIYAVMYIMNPVTPTDYFVSTIVGLIFGDIIAHTVLQLN